MTCALEKIMKGKKFRQFILAIIFAVVHFAVYFIFGLKNYDCENDIMPILLQIIGFSLLLLEIAFVIFSRLKKYSIHIVGMFLFRLFGIVIFVICFAMRIGGISEGWAFSLFDILSVHVRPLGYLLAPLIGVSEFFRKGIILGVLTYIEGSLAIGIKKQIKFERERDENKKMVASSHRED